jgi:hypothetical protein
VSKKRVKLAILTIFGSGFFAFSEFAVDPDGKQ